MHCDCRSTRTRAIWATGCWSQTQLISSGEVPYPVGCHWNVAFSGSRIQGQRGTGSRIRIRNTAATEMFFFLFSRQIKCTEQLPGIICTPTVLRSISSWLSFCFGLLYWLTAVVNNLPATGAGVPYFYQSVLLQNSTHLGNEKSYLLSLFIKDKYRNLMLCSKVFLYIKETVMVAVLERYSVGKLISVSKKNWLFVGLRMT